MFFFGTAKQVRLNGHPLKVESLVSTGWQRGFVRLPQEGANEIVFAGGGSLSDRTRSAGTSLRSDNGGDAWSNRDLGGDKHLPANIS